MISLFRVATGMQTIFDKRRYGGIDGGGAEWIELRLDSNFADDLRKQLATVPSATTIDTCTNLTPGQDWWPTQWPDDAKCYHSGRRFDSFILPDTGDSAWYIRSWNSTSDHYYSK